MTEITVNYYEALVGGDDRGCNMSVIAVFKNREDAEKVVKGKGFFGGDGSVSHVNNTIMVYDSLAEYDATLEDRLRKVALAKLSEDDKKILGLKN